MVDIDPAATDARKRRSNLRSGRSESMKYSHSKKLLAAIAVGGSLLAASPAYAATSSSGSVSAQQASADAGPSSADLKHWVSVRQRFGLDASPAYLQTLASLPTTTKELGVPLTSAESANIAARQRLNSINDSIYRLGKGTDAFGGVAIDQATGGSISLSVVDAERNTAAASSLVKAVELLVPSGVKVETSYVQYSLKELQGSYDAAVAKWVAGDLDSLNVDSINQEGDSLTFNVRSGTPPASVTSLKNVFPQPFVAVTVGESPDYQAGRNHTSGKLYGGEWISSSSGAQCTAGFSFAKGGSSGDSYYEITAGHCGKAGATWHQGLVYNDGNKFGVATSNNGAYSGTTSKCDCQSIGPVPASAATPAVYTSYTSTYSYTSLPTNTDDGQGYGIGRRVCVSGAASAEDLYGGGVDCGTIQSQNFSATSPGGVKLTNLIKTNTNTESGDSGAPLGDGGDFMGIHSGEQGGQEFFSRSVYIASVTGAKPTF